MTKTPMAAAYFRKSIFWVKQSGRINTEHVSTDTPDRSLIQPLGKEAGSIHPHNTCKQCFGSGSGMGKKSRSGSGMNNPDHITED
jgi:hypothetical protein